MAYISRLGQGCESLGHLLVIITTEYIPFTNWGLKIGKNLLTTEMSISKDG